MKLHKLVTENGDPYYILSHQILHFSRKMRRNARQSDTK